MPRTHDSDSSEAENTLEAVSKLVTPASDDSSSKKQAHEKCRIYACICLSMLITASTPHRSENLAFYAKAGMRDRCSNNCGTEKSMTTARDEREQYVLSHEHYSRPKTYLSCSRQPMRWHTSDRNTRLFIAKGSHSPSTFLLQF